MKFSFFKIGKKLSFANDEPALYGGSHDLDYLKERALKFIDRPFDKWTTAQKNAVRYLREFFDQDNVKEDVRATADLSPVIRLIGKALFLDGLRGIRAVWIGRDDEEQLLSEQDYNETLARTYGPMSRRGELILINTSHPLWLVTPKNQRWLHVLKRLLHEAIHSFLSRFVRWDALPREHEAAWHFIAAAVEKRAASELGCYFSLGREAVLVQEFDMKGRPILTPEEMEKCFGNRFSYATISRDGEETTTLQNWGWPIYGISAEQSWKYELFWLHQLPEGLFD